MGCRSKAYLFFYSFFWNKTYKSFHAVYVTSTQYIRMSLNSFYEFLDEIYRKKATVWQNEPKKKGGIRSWYWNEGWTLNKKKNFIHSSPSLYSSTFNARKLYTFFLECNQYLPRPNWIERNGNRLHEFVLIFLLIFFGWRRRALLEIVIKTNAINGMACPMSSFIWNRRRAISIPHRCFWIDGNEMFLSLRRWKLNKSHRCRSRVCFIVGVKSLRAQHTYMHHRQQQPASLRWHLCFTYSIRISNTDAVCLMPWLSLPSDTSYWWPMIKVSDLCPLSTLRRINTHYLYVAMNFLTSACVWSIRAFQPPSPLGVCVCVSAC